MLIKKAPIDWLFGTLTCCVHMEAIFNFISLAPYGVIMKVPCHDTMTSSNMKTFFTLPALFRGEFTDHRWQPPPPPPPPPPVSHRPVTWSFDVLFYLGVNKLLSKQSRGPWSKALILASPQRIIINPRTSQQCGVQIQTNRRTIRCFFSLFCAFISNRMLAASISML